MDHPPKRRVSFDSARVAGAFLTAALAGSISLALRPFFSLPVAIGCGFLLTWAFRLMLERALGLDPGASRAARVASGALAAGIACISVGLNSAAIYSVTSAQTTAVEEFELQRDAATRQLDLFAEGLSASSVALNALADHSAQQAKVEADTGGSCPRRPFSGRIAGPIARFRSADATASRAMADQLQPVVGTLRDTYAGVRQVTVAHFDQAQAMRKKINTAIDLAAGLKNGVLVSGLRDALVRQLSQQVTVGTDVFDCGDAKRNSLIEQSTKALTAVLALSLPPSLKASVNLADPASLAMSGIIRVSRLPGCILGRCNHADDPMLTRAMATSALNQVSIPAGLAVLLELLLAVATFAQRPGASPFPSDPAGFIEEAQRHRVAQAPTGWRRWASGAALMAAKRGLGVAYVDESAASPATAHHWPEATDDRGLMNAAHRQWTQAIARFTFDFADHTLIVVPYGCMEVGTERARAAGRALVRDRLARLVSDWVSLDDMAQYEPLADRIGHRFPGARHFEVFELLEPAAQSWRLDFIEGAAS